MNHDCDHIEYSVSFKHTSACIPYNCSVMIKIPPIWCHAEQDGFPFESGSSQGFFRMLSQ